jgi:diguanylate cyclase (GGDEF)-like protein
MGQTPSLSNAPRILLIDDSPQIAPLLRAWLSAEGVELVAAGDGEAGLRLAREVAPHVVLLDVDMPGLDGFETCRRLKSDPATAGAAVLFVSGASSSADKVRGLELGAVDYVTKPFDPVELRARIRAAIRTKFLTDLLERKAGLDALTGLLNRGQFDERLAAATALFQRHGRRFSLVLVDLDGFKQINDAHGHAAGDRAIQAAARVLCGDVRREDASFRVGGDEFAVLMPEVGLAGAVVLAERLRGQLAGGALRGRGGPVRMTASFGLAEATDGGANVYDRADEALYAAKRAGGNRVVTHDGHAVRAASAEVAPSRG